jgi:LAS superfamily LD-carboxypeptidase LdcB
MKKVIVLLTLCLSFTLNAQKVGKMKMSAEDLSSKATEYLSTAVGGLKEDQLSSIKALNLERFTKLIEFRNANKKAKDAIKAEAKKLRLDYRTKVKGILSADQITKLKEYVKTKKSEGKGKMKGKAKDVDGGIDMEDLEIE